MSSSVLFDLNTMLTGASGVLENGGGGLHWKISVKIFGERLQCYGDPLGHPPMLTALPI